MGLKKQIPMNILVASKIERADLLIVPFVQTADFSDRLTRMASKIGISSAELSASFKGEKKETFLVATPQRKISKTLLLGLGKSPDSAQIIQTFRSLFQSQKNKWSGSIAVDLKSMAEKAEYVVNGIMLATYELGMLKTDNKESTNVFTNGSELSILVNASQQEKVEASVKRGQLTAETQMNMMALVDAPSNYKTPQMMADYVVKSGKEHGFEVTVFDEVQCEEKGFHALLAVGRGSVDRPARMAVMEYKGGEKKVGFVGKGVTFDTGGVSLKPGDGMQDMKMDMGGSAAVIGAVELAAKLKLPYHVIGIVAFTENCIDALAIKPGDVIQSYAGKTIEVINTDAEGRLILADAIHYMVTEFKPEMMIDLATLTGSCIRTLGHVSAGLMTNSGALAASIEKAGLQTGEKVWRLPLTDDYKDELNSDVADIKNLGGAYAGATTAGKFLEYFTNEHPNWAHLDIAGTAFMKSEFSKSGSATAYGVRLLREVLESY